MTFPKTVVSHVSSGGLLPRGGYVTPFPYHFEFRGHIESIEPSPPSKDGFYREFEKGHVYRFTETLVPGFLKYDEKTQTACLNVTRYWEFSDADVMAAVKTRGRTQYRTSIGMSRHDVSVLHHPYLTSHEYDLEAMYETIVKEGHQRCADVSAEGPK